MKGCRCWAPKETRSDPPCPLPPKRTKKVYSLIFYSALEDRGLVKEDQPTVQTDQTKELLDPIDALSVDCRNNCCWQQFIIK